MQQSFLHLFHKLARGGGIVADHIHEWDDHWKVVNASFEEGLNANEDLQRFNGRMFYVWDNNHLLQAWMPYISRVHPYDFSWHIVVDSIMLDTRKGLVHLLVTKIDMNNKIKTKHCGYV
jgi:hypothetical protein